MKLTAKSIGIVLIFCLLFAFAMDRLYSRKNLSLKEKPNTNQWVFDYADLISENSRERIDQFLENFYEETDIEFIAVSIGELEFLQDREDNAGDINSLTSKLFENWKIGMKTRGHKGLLFIVSEKEQMIRLEVGNDLEGIFTDAFVGYIEREQMKPYFEQGRIGDGFEAALELIAGRTYTAIEEGSYDPDQTAGLGGTEFRSEGGGAKKNIAINSVKQQAKPSGGDDVHAFFVAQETPEETLELYFEYSRRRIKDPDVGIFTDETKKFLRQWTVTNAQQDSEKQYDGVSYVTQTQNDHSVIYYPEQDWTFSPFFFKKSQEGWQLDFAIMTKIIRFNQRNYWRFVSTTHPYMFAFKPYRIDTNGYVWFNQRANQVNEKELKEYAGVINIGITRRNGPIEIHKLYPGGAGQESGLMIGDVITQINHIKINKISWENLFKELRGPIDTTVDLQVFRPGENIYLDFEITREVNLF
jgi:uncharacterized protein